MFLPYPRVKVSIVGSLRDREVACSASDRQGSTFESCVWRTSHHPQEVLLEQFSLYVHKGGLKPDSFHFIVTNSDFASYQIVTNYVFVSYRSVASSGFARYQNVTNHDFVSYESVTNYDFAS